MTTHFKNLAAGSSPAAEKGSDRLETFFSGSYRTTFKRLFDILFVLAAAPIALPLIGLCALLISKDGASPFYWQSRVGRYGKSFKMLKLRTMVPNADANLENYLVSNPAARREWDDTQKLKDDPRITATGRLLRRSSLDELPQLWNVLCGNMSIVGPRPMMESQRALYPGSAYYKMRPGITGPWQVSDRNECSFAARAQFDADYYREMSARKDMSILLRTVGVVMRCTGY